MSPNPRHPDPIPEATMQDRLARVRASRNPAYSDHNTPRNLAAEARERREALADALAAFVHEEVEIRLRELRHD